VKQLIKNGVIAASMLLSSVAVASPIEYEFDIDYSGTTFIGADEYEVQGTGLFSLFGELDFGINAITSADFSNLSYQASFNFINQTNPGDDKIDVISIMTNVFTPSMYNFSLFIANDLNTVFWGNGGSGESSFAIESTNLNAPAIPALGTSYDTVIFHEPTLDLDGGGRFLLTDLDNLILIEGMDREYSMAMRNGNLGQPIPPSGGSNNVPEPSTWLLMAAGLAFTARRYKSK